MRLVIIALVAIALTLGGFMGYKLYERSQTSAQFREDASSLVTNLSILQEHHPEALVLLDKAHPGAFSEAYDFGGIAAPAKADEQAYQAAAIRDMWFAVEGRPDDDRLKILVYLLVKTNAVLIDGAQLPRNQPMEDIIREESP